MQFSDRFTMSATKLRAISLSLCIAMLLLGSCSKNSSSQSGTEGSSAPTSSTTESSPATATTASSGQVDINSAPIAELDKLELPGTKPSLSERIQGGRPYITPADLVTKKVISADEFKLIKELIVAGKSK
jgi:DNA uptake protein ComE-like DNA-binding protein